MPRKREIDRSSQHYHLEVEKAVTMKPTNTITGSPTSEYNNCLRETDKLKRHVHKQHNNTIMDKSRWKIS